MGRTIYYVASSIDGFIADEHDNIDWLLEFGFAEFQEHYNRFIAGVGAIVMGSTTYEFILGEGIEAWTYEVPAWVLTTRTLQTIDGADIRFEADTAAAVHERASAAAGERDIWVVGGGDVARQFAEAQLLDELHVTIMPVIVGRGKPLLPTTATRLRALGTTTFPSGAVEQRYAFDWPRTL
jgi:dihydrofolate reductase